MYHNVVSLGVIAKLPPPPNFFQSWDQVRGHQICNQREFITINGDLHNFYSF
jgi:hypothetical protein